MHGSKFRDGDNGTLVLGESGVGITVVYVYFQVEDVVRCTRLF